MSKDDHAKPGFHRMLVEGVPEAIIVSTPEGEITYFNPASERLLGYGAAEVTGANITMLVPQQPGQRADPVKWLKRWAAEPEYEQSRYLDLIARRKDGREMPVDVRVVEAQLDGAPRFLITFRDNTARRQEQIAFKERNLLFSRILMVAEDGIISVDAEQKIGFFNLKAEQMFGYRAEEVLGKPLSMLLPERFRKAHLGEVSAFGRSREASRWMSDRGPVTGLRKDGTEFPVDATITKVETGGRMTYTAHLRSSAGKTRRI
ncbi:PAS domain S-box protein [Parvibaculum sp.]|jgi:PAS domain S-box-containing protein|uniref:PAS domain-containing protein n=1 Tax=Parvibaculum sp. TaxID=2024848 RepID=UPI001B18C287|nr:PAS domain S-box protein [Parvibaculum sp.]MBO6633249.1 PAS domain S-box protein [Parvibaculum sp.]MBO6678033.1 PAS domain S-box protein [Parvibaculum sp.]MBO6683366.1 PAS domain S-box protein [Parvibaculum sp.]MBO6904038.1 PAS domain S-box protein [Parvibaculum sp.]